MSSRLFRDRLDAGSQLAERLLRYAGWEDVTVLGLPRGGVPVGAVVAARLRAPLDVLVVRKIGAPGHRELAVGAVGPGGVPLLDHEMMGRLGLVQADLEATINAERVERERRELAYREGRPPLVLADRNVLIVDDGLATGATAIAAVSAARAVAPAAVVVAVPVASAAGVRRLRSIADDVVAVATPSGFVAVGQWFDDFRPVTDSEVRRCLAPADGGAGLDPH